MVKRISCFVIILCLLAGLSACKEDYYVEPNRYTKEEGLHIFEENKGLFNSLAQNILADGNFLEHGDVHSDHQTCVMNSKSEDLKLFNEATREIILKLLEFKPYMIGVHFDEYGASYIHVTFIGSDEYESFSFFYLVDQSKQQGFIARQEQFGPVEVLSGDWIFRAAY